MDAEFLNWLTKGKSLSTRSAKDVISRYKRVCGLLKTDSLVNYTVDDLNLIVEFNDKSMFVKSQLKRALTLWKEYYELCQKKDIQ